MGEQEKGNIRPLYRSEENTASDSNKHHFSLFGVLFSEMDLSFLKELNNQNYLDTFPDNIDTQLLLNEGDYQIDGLVLPKTEYTLLSTVPYLSDKQQSQETSPSQTEQTKLTIESIIEKTQEELFIVDYIKNNISTEIPRKFNKSDIKIIETQSKAIFLNLLNIIADSNRWEQSRRDLTISLFSFQLLIQNNPNSELNFRLSELSSRYLKAKTGLLKNIFRSLY